MRILAMRITFHLDADTPIALPRSYNHEIQGFIYKSLPKEDAQKLHENGFSYEKRTFKLFTFSRILGSYTIDYKRQIITLSPPITLKIASPIDWILQGMAEGLLQKRALFLGKNEITLTGIQVDVPVKLEPPVKIRMLSPMTVYSTYLKPDGRKRVDYYSPFESDFSDQISENLRKKFLLVYGESINGNVLIKPLFSRSREHNVRFKQSFFKAWDGNYTLAGDPELIRIAYECGLGAKNSMGFGMWEKWRSHSDKE